MVFFSGVFDTVFYWIKNKEQKVIRRIDRSGGIGKRRASKIFYDVIKNSELIFFVKCIYRKVKIDFISFSIPTENDFF